MVRFIKPNSILAPYIERYWIWDIDSTDEIYMPQVPPGLGIDLFLHYKSPFVIEQEGKLSPSHIICSGDRTCHILPMKKVGFIAIRFRVGMFKNFTAIPPGNWVDSFLDGPTFWNREGRELLEQVEDFGDRNAMMQKIESFLVAQLSRYKKELNEWDLVVKELFYNHSEQKLVDLSRAQHLSYRHFRRKFIEKTGFTPKHFQRLARFRATLKPLLIKKEKNYLPAALENGYFDQAHFIKEFRHFIGCTPTAFLQEKNFMSHFYNSSW